MLIASTLIASTAGPLFTRQINRKQWHCSVQAPRGLIVTLLKSSFSEICEEIVSGVRSAHTRHYLSIADGYQKIVIIAWLWSLKQKHTLPDHRPVLLKVKQNIRYFHSGHHREKSRLNLNAVHFNFIVCLFVFAHTYLRTRCLLRVRVKCLSPKQRGQSDIGDPGVTSKASRNDATRFRFEVWSVSKHTTAPRGDSYLHRHAHTDWHTGCAAEVMINGDVRVTRFHFICSKPQNSNQALKMKVTTGNQSRQTWSLTDHLNDFILFFRIHHFSETIIHTQRGLLDMYWRQASVNSKLLTHRLYFVVNSWQIADECYLHRSCEGNICIFNHDYSTTWIFRISLPETVSRSQHLTQSRTESWQLVSSGIRGLTRILGNTCTMESLSARIRAHK